MSHQTINHLNTFYNIIIREHVTDPLINSEWNYFMSVLESAQKDRIDMYLNILTSEQTRKNKSKSTHNNFNYSKHSPFKNQHSQSENARSTKQFDIQTKSKKCCEQNNSRPGRNNYLNQNNFDQINLNQANFQLNKRYSEPPCRIFYNQPEINDSLKANNRQRERSQGYQKYYDYTQKSPFIKDYSQHKYIQRQSSSKKQNYQKYPQVGLVKKQKFKQKHSKLWCKAQNLMNLFARNCIKIR